MIVKERKKPVKIQKLEALLRRLPPQHPKQKEIEENLAKSLSGYRGEQSLDYYLSFLPPKQQLILHDLRLKENGRYFQIDTLILTKAFILIIEAKNIAGTIFFDTAFHQLIRTIDGKEEAFPDPIMQITRQKQQLQQ
ncbi:MAG: nuclease-related domain-containing protein [Ectobacillus sp.]